MKIRNFFKISFFAVASFLFFSCSDFLETERISYNDFSLNGNARLILSIGVGNGARTIFADDAPLEEMNYILSGSSYTGGTISIPLSYEKNTGKLIRNDGETEIFVGKGTWNFKLTASKHETALYESEIFNFDTKAGDNALYFKLSEIKTAQGYGDIDITLNFYNEIGATKIVVDLLDLEGRVYNTALQKTFNFEPILKQTTVNYKLANVTSGAYIVQFAFFDSGTSPCHIYRELVQVRPNRTSTAEREIEKFERCHFITLDNINSEDFVLAGTSMSLMFNEQEQVILPTKNDVSRKGYELEGWYKSENGVESKYTIIPYGTTSNITLYAKWKLIPIETITFTNAVNASGNIELKEKTLTLNVDISPNPETLADEAKNLTWSCSGNQLRINQNGVVSLIGDLFNENATITVTAPGGAKAEIVIEGYVKVLTQEGFRKLCEDAGSTYESITSFVITDDYTIIDSGALSGCSALTNLTIPFVGGYADSTISNKNKATRFGYIFGNKSYNGSTFANLYYIPSSLKEVTVNGGKIFDSAFMSCSTLTSITLSNRITYIDSAFNYCSSLTTLRYKGTIEDWCGIRFGYGTSNPMCYAQKFYLGDSTEELTEVVIPNTVTKIGAYQFYGFNNVTKITIPDSVTSIGNSAFKNCSSLTEISLPNGITSIGGYAFSNCSSLAEISIPDGITSIGGYVFYYCSSLSKISLPNRLTSIGEDAFGRCISMEEIELPNSLTSIERYAFSGCVKLKNFTFSNNISYIGIYAFENCTELKSITIDFDSVLFDWSNIFESTKKIDEVHFNGTLEQWCGISFKNYYYNLMYYAKKFYLGDSTEELTEIVIPDSVTEIGSAQFYGFENVTKITIPNSVTSIGNDAFANCSSLTSITISSGFPSIGESVFKLCRSLNELHFDGTFEQWCGMSFVNENSNLMCYAKKFYLGDSTEELTEIVIPNTITEIGKYQFYGFNNVRKVTIPDSVTSIGKDAFGNCSSITEISIPNSVTSIGSSAFSGCSSLPEISLPNNVTSIGACAFQNCSSFTKVTIPDSVTSIGNSVFYGCSSLTEIRFEGTLEQWCRIAFDTSNPMNYAKKFFLGNSTEELTEIVIPNSVTEIGSAQFDGFDHVTKITIPDSVTSIGNSAFRDCSSITEISIPNSVTSIGKYAFYNCSSLKKLTIPTSVTFIGAYAFCGCSSITSATFESKGWWWATSPSATSGVTIDNLTIKGLTETYVSEYIKRD